MSCHVVGERSGREGGKREVGNLAWAVGPVGGMTRRREGRCPNSGVGIRQGSIRFN